MENVIFIIVNNSSLYIRSKYINEKYDFDIHGCLENNGQREVLNKISVSIKAYNSDYEVVLLLNENFFYSISKEKYELIPDEINDREIITDNSFFDTSEILVWRLDLLVKLINYFSDNNIKISTVQPITYFLKKTNNDKRVFISLQKRSVYLTFIDSSGHLKKFSELQCGLQTIVEDISNALNISLNYSLKIIKYCGYVYVPESLSDHVIDISYGKDMEKAIELSHICMLIRRSLAKIFNNNMSDLCDSGISVIFNSEEKLHGLSDFIAQNFSKNLTIFNYDELNYPELIEKFNLINQKGKEKLIPEKITDNISEVVIPDNSRVISGFLHFFEEKIHSFTTLLFQE
ncbi:MAG: hypothetical protein LBQ22_10940 [Bacteroidales bacterium]|jgi:hypothetical protein|nr:hypothetical protein [Bacteroidales bacterium]